MSAASSRVLVRSSVLKGIENAYATYNQMANEPLHRAPEFLLATHIAEQLEKKASPCWVTLESSIKEVLQTAGAKANGRSAKVVSYKGRFDVVLWYRIKGKPRAVIEVKHPLNVASASRIDKDVERICRVVSTSKAKGGSLKFGIFAFFTRSAEPKAKDKNATARIRRRVEPILERCKSLTKKHDCVARLTISRVHRAGEEAWAACAVSITAK